MVRKKLKFRTGLDRVFGKGGEIIRKKSKRSKSKRTLDRLFGKK